jgi:serine/threonine protein kinase
MNHQNDQQPEGFSTALAFEKINSICQSFSDTWSADFVGASKTQIEAHLNQVEREERVSLLRNLLPIEIERRKAIVEDPQIDDYLSRFPQFGSLIRQVFLTSASGAANATIVPSKAEIGFSARHLGDYRIERELGRGGMGMVFEAVHVVHRSRVELKTLPVNDGPALHRFKREFRSVAELNHPNLVGLHELASDGTQWFFTMDLVDGSDFISYVRPNNQPDEKRLRAATAQLVQAVIALHSNHIIHRDLKPSNVMVTQQGRVIVLDFGLVLELDQVTGAKSLAHVAGTPAYMAPEQAASEKITGASDWYAVGVMLYESLTGKLPFTGKPLKLLQD